MESFPQIEYHARSDIGLRRANNQDAHVEVLASTEDRWRQRGHLFVVADGMGAHAAGELASRMAVETISHVYNKLKDLPVHDALRQAVKEANARIHEKGEADPDFRGMGTTCSAMVLLPQAAIVAHVGDSRIYRLRQNQLEQLTFDHSLIWEMTAAGHMSHNRVPTGIPKNIITRSLGPNPTVEIDVEGPFPICPGDAFLLCSDGLSGQIGDRELGAVLSCMPPKEAADTLVNLANLHGGPDNITVIVAKVPSDARSANDEQPCPKQAAAAETNLIPIAASVIAAVALIISVALVISSQPLVWAGLLAVAAAGLGYFAVLHFGNSTAAAHELPEKPLGKGPHAHCGCAVDMKFATELESLFRHVKDASPADAEADRAEQIAKAEAAAKDAMQAKRCRDAIQAWSSAIQLAMQGLGENRAN